MKKEVLVNWLSVLCDALFQSEEFEETNINEMTIPELQLVIMNKLVVVKARALAGGASPSELRAEIDRLKIRNCALQQLLETDDGTSEELSLAEQLFALLDVTPTNPLWEELVVVRDGKRYNLYFSAEAYEQHKNSCFKLLGKLREVAWNKDLRSFFSKGHLVIITK